MLEEQKLAAEEILKAAQSRLDGLYMTLSLLKEMRSKPLTLIVNVHRAEDQVSLARAALKVAEAERNASTAPPSPEEVALAEASIQKAEAALAIARWQEDRLLITSPIAGRIQAQMIKSGEVVQAGKPLLRIADTSRMEVWAYVPQEDLHTVSLGARFPVEVIAIPDQRFEGEVFFIASEAQFRPNNVLNPDDRGDMVFLFKLWLDNTDGVLKPGMPADVILP
jgi:HlyD family secretion protein